MLRDCVMTLRNGFVAMIETPRNDLARRSLGRRAVWRCGGRITALVFASQPRLGEAQDETGV